MRMKAPKKAEGLRMCHELGYIKRDGMEMP